MNIIFISTQSYPSGMAGSKRIRLFAEYLGKKYKVTNIIYGPSNGNNPNKGLHNNVTYQYIPFNRFQQIFGFFKIRKVLNDFFRKNTQNIVVLYNGIGITNILFAILAKNKGGFVITDIVEDYSLHKENTGFLLTLMHKVNTVVDKRINNFADGIIVISQTLKAKYLTLGLPENKLSLISISAENLFINKDKKPSNVIRFVYSGSYGNKDGVKFLLKAFKIISEKKDADIELLLSGKINSKIEKMIVNLSGIKYVGLVPDSEFYQFLKNADILMMTRINSPYANAGFPFKLGEYLATRNPVIATNVSDINLYLEDKKDIIMVEPSNTQSLVEAMEFVIKNREKIIEIGNNGYKKCYNYFNPNINGQSFENFIKTIVKI